jgi:hypothetical protein
MKFSGRPKERPMQSMDESFYRNALRYFYLDAETGRFWQNKFRPYSSPLEMRHSYGDMHNIDLCGYFMPQVPVPEAKVYYGKLGQGKYHIDVVGRGKDKSYRLSEPIMEYMSAPPGHQLLYKQLPIEVHGSEKLICPLATVQAARLAWYIYHHYVPVFTESVILLYRNRLFRKDNLFVIPRGLSHLYKFHRNTLNPTSKYRFVSCAGDVWAYDVSMGEERYRAQGFKTELAASHAVEKVVHEWKLRNGYPVTNALRPKETLAEPTMLEANLKTLRHAKKLVGFNGPDSAGFYRIRFKGTQLHQTRNRKEALAIWFDTCNTEGNYDSLEELLEVHLEPRK